MKTILIVEDDANQAMLYAEELTDEGYRVLSADSEGAALAMMGEAQPDLVMLDMPLHNMERLDVLRQMSDLQPQVAVIAVTAYPSCDDELQNFVCACVVKSSDLAELKSHILRAVGPGEERR